MGTTLRGTFAATLATVGLVAGSAVTAPSAQAVTTSLKSSIDSTYQANGRVDAIVTVGTVTYVGGDFTALRPPGTLAGDPAEQPRAHLAAVDNTTGQLLAWNPGTDGTVRALAASPDGTTIYAGGDFGTAGGHARRRFAAINAATGAATALNAPTDSSVTALAATADHVYLGGSFSTVAGQPRQRLASVSPSGSLDPVWVPTADNTVRAIDVAPDNSAVYVGGRFATVNGTTQKMFTKLDPVTGATMPWSSHPSYPVLSIAATATNVYVGGDGSGGHAAAYTTLGSRLWLVQTDGAVQAVATSNGVLYVGGHFDNVCVGDTSGATTGFTCPTVSATRHKLLAVDAATAALDPWAPNPNSVNGVWALETPGSKLEVGGDFTAIGTKPRSNQQCFAQFS